MSKNKYLILLIIILLGFVLYFTAIKFGNVIHLGKDTNIKMGGEEVDFTISNTKEILSENSYSLPIWSPDGKKITYTTPDANGIFIMDKDGMNRTILTNDVGAGYKYSWSLDNKNIAYRGVIFEGNTRTNFIGIIDVKNRTTEIISMPNHANIQPPVWNYSENEKRVEYILNGKISYSKPYPFLYKNVINKDSLENINRSLYYADQGLYLIENNNKTEKIISEGFDPVFSPDRQSFVYSKWSNLHLFSLKDNSDKFLDEGYHPSWSPDGKYIVYHKSIDNGDKITSSDLYIFDIDELKKKQFTNTSTIDESNPSWSPDGMNIIFEDFKSGKIYLTNLK